MGVRTLRRADATGEQFPSAILDSLSEAVVVVNGVEGTRSAPITIVRDTTAPALTVTAPAPGAILSGDSVAVTGKTDKDIDVQVRNETTGTIESGRSTTKGAFSIDIALRDGTNVLTVTARDGAGNTATATLTVTYTPPSGLGAAYAFDEGAGTTSADVSGNGHTATLVNAPSWVPGQFGSALSFAIGAGASAPGQLPIEDLKAVFDILNRAHGR